MLLLELRVYLKTHLANPSIDFKWSDEDNSNFFAFLDEKFTHHSLQTDENQFKIKQAFKEYFESVGYILFKLKDKQIRIKVFPYKIEPKESINLDAILKILQDNEELIEYDYKGNENQISVSKELKEKLYDFVNSIANEEINRKELVRYAVTHFFELKNSDIVIIKDDQIFIKILDDKNRRIVTEDEKNTIANRYNGINEEDLKAFHRDFFSKQENKDFFYFVAKTFVGIYLVEKKIDNFTYEKNVFAFIQSIVLEQLTNTFNHNDDFFRGFSGYIFRIHFKEVFGHISYFILIEIAASNSYMINFLKYYSLNIIVLDGLKYQVPQLETEGGLKWNVISMLSIVKIYVKIKTSIDIAKKDIADINNEIQALYIADLPPLEYQNIIIKEKEKVSDQIVQCEKKVEKFYDSLDLEKDEEKKALFKKEIQEMKEEMRELRETKNKLTSKMLKTVIITEYNALRNEMDGILRQMQREKKVLEQNEKSYLSIKNALAKALASKKVLIE